MSVTTREPCTLLRVRRDSFQSIWRNNSHLQIKTTSSPENQNNEHHDMNRQHDDLDSRGTIINTNNNSFNPILIEATTIPPTDLSSSSSGVYSQSSSCDQLQQHQQPQSSIKSSTFYCPSPTPAFPVQHYNHESSTTGSSSTKVTSDHTSTSSSSSISHKSQRCSCPCSLSGSSPTSPSVSSSSSLHVIKDLKVRDRSQFWSIKKQRMCYIHIENGISRKFQVSSIFSRLFKNFSS